MGQGQQWRRGAFGCPCSAQLQMGCTCAPLHMPAPCIPPALPLPQAIAAGHAAAVAALVGGGLDPNSRLPDSGLSLLEAAAHHGRGEVITALIRGGLSGGCWRPLASTSAGDLLPDSCGFLSVVVCMPAQRGPLWQRSRLGCSAHLSSVMLRTFADGSMRQPALTPIVLAVRLASVTLRPLLPAVLPPSRGRGRGCHQRQGGERAAQAGAVVEGQPDAGEPRVKPPLVLFMFSP